MAITATGTNSMLSSVAVECLTPAASSPARSVKDALTMYATMKKTVLAMTANGTKSTQIGDAVARGTPAASPPATAPDALTMYAITPLT